MLVVIVARSEPREAVLADAHVASQLRHEITHQWKLPHKDAQRAVTRGSHVCVASCGHEANLGPKQSNPRCEPARV